MIQARQLEYIVSIILIALGIYVAANGIKYGYLDAGTPGAGFFPFWIGTGMALLSGFNLFRNFSGRLENESIPLREIGRVLLASAAMAGFILASESIGMLASIFLLMLAVGALFGPVNVRFYAILLAIAAAMTAFLYVVFGHLLNAPII